MVCHKIASEHDSRVEFDHAQGRGTIFCLSLPCATVHAESDTHAGDRPGQPGGALASGVNKELPMAKRILVVDDEMDLSTFVSKVLESRGYRVGVAGDGEQGLRQARVQTAAGHPERDDAQTKRPENVPRPQDLYYEFKDTRMLIISGLARKTFLHSQGVLDKFKKQSMPEPDDYIEKPPEPEEILVEVSRLIGD